MTTRVLTLGDVTRLVEHLFDGAVAEPLAEEVAAWLTASLRFRSFVDVHRDKIRRKLRGAADAESRASVRTELDVARLLLADRRIALGYEVYGSGRRGPDFSVSYRDHPAFDLEVTRLLRPPDAAVVGGAIVVKLRQLPPSTANVLLLSVEGSPLPAEQIATLVTTVRRRADSDDASLLRDAGVAGRRAFYDRFLRLGAVVMRSEGGAGAVDQATVWTNQSARIAVPAGALRAALACLFAGSELGARR